MTKTMIFLFLSYILSATFCWAEGNVTPEWREAGFNDYEASGWMANGFPELIQATAWKKAGFSASKAKTWRKKRISPDDAIKWNSLGINKAKTAGKLAKKGISPEKYAAWQAKGYKEAKEILGLKEKGMAPETVSAKQ